MKGLLLLILVTLGHLAAAQTRSDLNCVFKEPIMFGASVSAGYGGIPDGIAGRLSRGLYHGNNLNPIAEMQRIYHPGPSTNLSEMVGGMPDSGNGVHQLKRLLRTPAGRQKFANCSVLGGIDAFYWPSVEAPCKDTLADVDYLISLAAREKKPLILGNLPIENPAQISPILVAAGWKPPPANCVAQLNAKMKKECKSENQCYLVNINSMVKKLNSPSGVVYGRQRLFSRDVRFDGIHLTPIGRQYIMSLIAAQLKANPAQCSSPANPVVARSTAPKAQPNEMAAVIGR